MKLQAVAIALALTGLGTSVAVAQGPLPDTAAPAASAPRARIAVCHRTRPAGKRFRLLAVSRSAVERHMRHGDLLAQPSGTCLSRTGSA